MINHKLKFLSYNLMGPIFPLIYITYNQYNLDGFSLYVTSIIILNFIDFLSAGFFNDKLKLGRSTTVLLQYLQFLKFSTVSVLLIMSNAQIDPLLVNSAFPVIYYLERQHGSLILYLALRILLILSMFAPKLAIFTFLGLIILVCYYAPKKRLFLKREKVLLTMNLIMMRGIAYLNQLPLIVFVLVNPMSESLFIIYRAYTFLSAQTMMYFTRFLLHWAHMLVIFSTVLCMYYVDFSNPIFVALISVNLLGQIFSSPMYRKYKQLRYLTAINCVSGLLVAMTVLLFFVLNIPWLLILAEALNLATKITFLWIVVRNSERFFGIIK